MPDNFQLTSNFSISRSALFSSDRTLRREIRRWWVDQPTRWVAWLMLNPSIAGEVTEDPTAIRVTHFSREWGFDGWIGVNLYPFISSEPKRMWAWAASGGIPSIQAMAQNLDDIGKAGREAEIRMAAFGAEAIEQAPEWITRCLESFALDGRLYCLGTNSSGQPLHPMARGKKRIPDHQQPVPWIRR